MQQPERPPEVEERREEQHAQRDPDVRRVQLAPERARVAARHRPGDLVAGPLLERSRRCGRPPAPGRPPCRRGRSSPASARGPSCTRSAGAARPSPRLPHLLGPRRDPLDLARAVLEEARRLGLRRRAGRGPARVRAGAAPQQATSADCERRARLSRATARCAKLHILFPTKLSGVAATIEIAWAGSSGMPATLTSSSRIAEANRNAATLTVKKRAAWKPARPPRARKVQCRFHQKLLITATTKASVAATRWWRSSSSTHDGEHAQVHHVAGPADRAELHSCTQLCGLRRPGAHAQVHRRVGGRRRRPRLVGHAANGTPKCSSTNGVTSASDHCSRSGASTPQSSSTPSESSRWSEPWLPPPTWSAPPQSTNS